MGHAGHWKSLELVSQNYWWPQMFWYVSQYIGIYDLCIKPIQYLPLGELIPLAVINTRWDTISMNFVVKLPELSEYNVVMTVVDSVSKRAHFILTHTTVTAESIMRLFLHHVWKLYSLPNCIISDRGPQFVIFFTRKLYCLLRVEITSLIAWYLQFNRQTEQVNQKLNQYL